MYGKRFILNFDYCDKICVGFQMNFTSQSGTFKELGVRALQTLNRVIAKAQLFSIGCNAVCDIKNVLTPQTKKELFLAFTNSY